MMDAFYEDIKPSHVIYIFRPTFVIHIPVPPRIFIIFHSKISPRVTLILSARKGTSVVNREFAIAFPFESVKQSLFIHYMLVNVNKTQRDNLSSVLATIDA